LTQEQLAERAGLSHRSISDLERGISRAPHKDTLALLASALQLSERDRAALDDTVRRLRHDTLKQQITERAAPGLPAAPTLLIGREHEEAAITHLLRAEARLVTLTGPAGIGKTRLALQVAGDLDDTFADGIVFVALATLRDPERVPIAIAEALRLREGGSQSLREILGAHLRDKQLLLVLDNCEQVLAAAPLVAQLLADCAQLKVLATSRASLRIRGECEFAVPPLDLPEADQVLTREDLGRFAAVALFVQRVRDHQPTFVVSQTQAPIVAAICQRLDGIPLAIELAAARIKLLPPRALLQRLAPRLPLLTGGARDLPVRQQTMRDAIGWSYDLLDAAEQRLFRRLAVFEGGWTLEAAAAVCAEPEGAESGMLDGLTSLVEKNLARQTELEGEPRFHMLELIREYGTERLAASADAEMIAARFAGYILALAEQAEPGLRGEAQSVWLARLTQEYGNIRSVLRWARDGTEGEVGLRLAGALWLFWYARGQLSEGRRWLSELLARDAGVAPPAARAKALLGASVLAAEQGDYDAATPLADGSLALFQALGDTRGSSSALSVRGNVAKYQGDYAQAVAAHEACLSLRRTLGDPGGIAAALNNLGIIASEQGDYARAEALYKESLTIKRTLGDARGVANSLMNLGDAARHQGNAEHARQLADESLALFTELDDKRGMATALNNLGVVARDLGDHPQAVAASEQSLALFRQLGSKWGIALTLTHLGDSACDLGDAALARARYGESLALYQAERNTLGTIECLEGLASVVWLEGAPERAACLYGATAARRAAGATPLPPADRARLDQRLAEVRVALGVAAFTAAFAAGGVMTLEQAAASVGL
jgi:predicted ATPase